MSSKKRSKRTINTIKQEWDACEKIKVFEIDVVDKRTGDNGYVLFDIELRGRTFYATHEALTTKEEKSKKIAFEKVVVDPFYSLDFSLGCLYDECFCAISESDFYSHQY